MAKTLTITDRVYNELVEIKGKDESFSVLFDRLAKKEKSGISEFAGFLSEKDAVNVKRAISDYRKKSEKTDIDREKRLEKLWQ